jgi:hypothetical protein
MWQSEKGKECNSSAYPIVRGTHTLRVRYGVWRVDHDLLISSVTYSNVFFLFFFFPFLVAYVRIRRSLPPRLGSQSRYVIENTGPLFSRPIYMLPVMSVDLPCWLLLCVLCFICRSSFLPGDRLYVYCWTLWLSSRRDESEIGYCAVWAPTRSSRWCSCPGI